MSTSSMEDWGISTFWRPGVVLCFRVLSHFSTKIRQEKLLKFAKTLNDNESSCMFFCAKLFEIFSNIYYSQEELKHFGLQMSLISGYQQILSSKPIKTLCIKLFQIFSKINFGKNVPKNQKRKNFGLITNIFELIKCQNDQIFTKISSGKVLQYLQIIYNVLYTSITFFFNLFTFFKFNMLDKKAVLMRLKIKTLCLLKKLF